MTPLATQVSGWVGGVGAADSRCHQRRESSRCEAGMLSHEQVVRLYGEEVGHGEIGVTEGGSCLAGVEGLPAHVRAAVVKGRISNDTLYLREVRDILSRFQRSSVGGQCRGDLLTEAA